jgi:hypothetical protein
MLKLGDQVSREAIATESQQLLRRFTRLARLRAAALRIALTHERLHLRV